MSLFILHSPEYTYTDGNFDISVKTVANFFNDVVDIITFGHKIASFIQYTE
jgi:hypothetical protein